LVAAKLDSIKKLPKTPKGEKEETYGPLKSGSTNGNASTEKESSKGEASKDSFHVVEQVYFSNFLDSNEEGKRTWNVLTF
jgi:hypothetical protein